MSKIVITKIEDFIRQKKIFMTHIFPNTIHKAAKRMPVKVEPNSQTISLYIIKYAYQNTLKTLLKLAKSKHILPEHLYE